MSNEKENLIKQLKTLSGPLTDIDILTRKRDDAISTHDSKKRKLESIRDSKGKYNLENVSYPKLSTNNESLQKSKFDSAHRIKQAEKFKRKAKSFISLILIIAVVSIIATAVMNIIAYNNDPTEYLRNFAKFTQSNRANPDLDEVEKLSKLPIHYAFILIDALMFVLLSTTFIKSFNKKVTEANEIAGIHKKKESGIAALGSKIGGLYLKGFTVIMTICGIVLLVLETPILVACPILLFVVYFILRKKLDPYSVNYFSYTSSESKELSDARVLDEKNRKENEKNKEAAIKKAKAAQEAKWKKEYSAANDEYVAAGNAVNEYTRQIDAIRANLPKDIVGAGEMNSSSVNSLISYLSTGRADTLKEALACLDKENAERARTDSLLRQQQFQHDLDRQMDDWKRKDDLRRYESDLRDLKDRADAQHRESLRAQERHNKEVESILRDLTKN